MKDDDKEGGKPPGPDTRPADLNRTSEQFWKARGYPTRPADWQTRDPKLPPPAEKK